MANNKVSIPAAANAGVGHSQGRPAGALSGTTKIRIEKVARMRIAGIRDQKIAEVLGMTGPALFYLTKLPEYKDVELCLLEGTLTEYDRALSGQIAALKQEVRQAVPAALRCLVDSVTQRKDLKAALAAAGEILDRDPDRTFIKAKSGSESEAPTQHLPDIIIEQVSSESDSIGVEIKSKERIQ